MDFTTDITLPASSHSNLVYNIIMPIGYLTLHIELPGCKSLKEKRSRIKPILSRLQKEFNISTAELDYQDHWSESVIGCVNISNNATLNTQVLQRVIAFVENHWPDCMILASTIETR